MQNIWQSFFFVDMRVSLFSQAGLELLISSDPAALAFQSAEITGVSQRVRPQSFFFGKSASPTCEHTRPFADSLVVSVNLGTHPSITEAEGVTACSFPGLFLLNCPGVAGPDT